MNADALDAALWEFCTDIYAEPGVAAACLALQDEAGADVTLLLAALWSAVEGPGLLQGAELDALDRAVAPWRDNVVQPLRQVRRWTKAALHHHDPMRDELKALELCAERRALAKIAAWLERAPPLPAAGPDEAMAAFARWLGCDVAALEPLTAAYLRSR
ncbi:MAG: TIGR02444 family protein [Alphaproteobacteria bacterium]